MVELNPGCKTYQFHGQTGYVLQSAGATDDHSLIAIGHTASIKPWRDPCVHQHTTSEEYYFLRKGVLKFLVSDAFITLYPNEILMVKPQVPHAIISGEGEIEHFGIRVPYVKDKQELGKLPRFGRASHEDRRSVSGDWGHRIALDDPRHQNCWLFGSGAARFQSAHMVMTYLNFPNNERANAGIGTRHRMHLHQRSSEFYTVLAGTKILNVEGKGISIEAGSILEIPPHIKHVLHSRRAPFEGFTIRVPVALNDKIEFGDA